MVNLFTKSRNRGNFAALLVCELFDKETRKKSNVRGHGKEQMDPEIIKYIHIMNDVQKSWHLFFRHVKEKVFEYYPLLNADSEKDEWELCIQSIDVKNRALNRSKENNANAANK